MAYFETTQQIPVPFANLNFSAGTWALTDATNVFTIDKTAADNTTVVRFVLPLPRRSDIYGVKINGIYLPAFVTTANLDAAPTIALYRQDYSAVDATASATSVITSTAITLTAGAGLVVTADADPRLWSATVTTPAVDSSFTRCVYVCEITIDAGASTVVKLGVPTVDVTIIE